MALRLLIKRWIVHPYQSDAESYIGAARIDEQLIAVGRVAESFIPQAELLGIPLQLAKESSHSFLPLGTMSVLLLLTQ